MRVLKKEMEKTVEERGKSWYDNFCRSSICVKGTIEAKAMLRRMAGWKETESK